MQISISRFPKSGFVSGSPEHTAALVNSLVLLQGGQRKQLGLISLVLCKSWAITLPQIVSCLNSCISL